jgi:fatty acid desaturase
MLVKTLYLLGAISTVYYVAVFRGVFWLAPLVGMLMAVMGLAIQHDANHGAFSSSPAVNKLFGFCDDIIGGSALCWRHQHMVAHHADPNHAALDADTYHSFPLLRMNPALPRRWFQSWQHVYAWPLY